MKHQYLYEIIIENHDGLTLTWTQDSKAKTNKGLAAGSNRIINRLLKEYPDHREITVKVILYNGLANLLIREEEL